jgi:hypothetical protein
VCVRHGSVIKQLRHPGVGELMLECEVLDIARDGHRLVLYNAAPGSPSADAPQLLRAVGTQWPAGTRS